METGAPTQPLEIAITYDGATRRGSLRIEAPTINTIWDRLKQTASTTSNDARITDRLIELSWSGVLDILRDYGNRDSQRIFDFRFRPDAIAKEKIAEFTQARQIVRQAQGKPSAHHYGSRNRRTGWRRSASPSGNSNGFRSAIFAACFQ